MKGLLNSHAIAAIALAVALPAITHASTEGTYTPQQPSGTHSAKVCMPIGNQNELDKRAAYHAKNEDLVKVSQYETQQNAGRNTLDPLEPNYVWWQ